MTDVCAVCATLVELGVDAHEHTTDPTPSSPPRLTTYCERHCPTCAEVEA